MDNFIYYVPTKIIFGKGEENNVAKYLNEYNPSKVMLVYGTSSVKKSGLLEKVKHLLDEANIKYVELGGVKPNPELPLVREGIALALKEKVDFVLALGGGSVIDTAKDIANGSANPSDDVWDYHIKKKMPANTLKKAAILTLSAAGSEMSNSAVITNPEVGIKSGYNSDMNRLDFAICNPELTYTVSKYQTACGAVDIAMHSIERYFALGEESGLTDDICLAVIKDAFKYGKDSFDYPNDYVARANMMWASSLAHNNLTGCGRTFLLTVHQLEHDLSAKYPSIAHGAGLAALWCSWARYVYKYCLERWANYVNKIWDVDISNSDDLEEAILLGIKRQEDYYRSIGMPIAIKELGVKEIDLEDLALRTSKNKTRTIPGYKPLEYFDLLEIYKMSYNA